MERIYTVRQALPWDEHTFGSPTPPEGDLDVSYLAAVINLLSRIKVGTLVVTAAGAVKLSSVSTFV